MIKPNLRLSQTAVLWPDLPQHLTVLRLAEHHAYTVHSFLITADPNLDALTSAAASNDNAQVLPRLFRAGGWRVRKAQHRAIHRAPAGLACNDETLAQFDPNLAVGFGPHQGSRLGAFIGRFTPAQTDQSTKRPSDEHGKAAWIEHSADTYMAAEPERLIATMQKIPASGCSNPWRQLWRGRYSHGKQ